MEKKNSGNYYDARYPGDNFVIVTVDELREALEIMLDVVEAVNCWRTSHELEILIADPRGVSISNEQIETEILKLCENLYTQYFLNFGVNSMYNAKLCWKKNLWMKE